MYQLHGAKTPKDFVDNILLTAVSMSVFICLISTILKMPTIFICIDKFEKFINESEFNFIVNFKINQINVTNLF